MPRSPRIQFEGAYYHVFNRGVAKQAITFDERDCRTFMQLLGETVTKFQLRLFAYCLMKNHYHLFLQTLLPNLELALQRLQGEYVRYVNFRHERVGSLFQGRYKSRLVEADAYALTLIRYIHQNPVEAGIVSNPEDYPWSSYPCYVQKLPRWPWLDTEWTFQQLDSKEDRAVVLFQALHEKTASEPEREKFERMTRILGSKAFKLTTLLRESKKGVRLLKGV